MGCTSLREIARVLGGDVVGAQVVAPGPGHSARDRSMGVRLAPTAPDGFTVVSFAGDDWQACKDHVRQRLGLRAFDKGNSAPPPRPAAAPAREVAGQDDTGKRRVEAALRIWHEARDPRGTVVEAYLASRGLELPNDMAGWVIRFHEACPFGEGQRLPATVALLRDVRTDEPRGIHRTALTPDGKKVGRKMLGVAGGAAVKLDDDADVTTGLAIGEGVETCMAARRIGLRPVWALASVGGIASFPALAGIEALTILCEAGEASRRAAEQCAARWHSAGKEVLFARPRAGSDINDAILGVA